MQLIGFCSELLVNLFKPHGIIAVNHKEGFITLPDHPAYRFALQVYKSNEKIVLLEAVCEFGPGQLMKERLAGVGETQEQAIMDAQRNFVSCVFHVWLSAFFGKSNEYTNEYFWQINGIERRVLIGSPSGRGDLDASEDARWQEKWYQLIRTLKIRDGLHWASLCYTQQDEKFIACDALLDNNSCETVKQEIQKFSWPSRKNFYSVRQFMIIADA
ncbi:MAG: hypothetical protein KIT34_02190 [Cyanobacteria bacterium TGS_CYA1]|nr:hypothetical protein [Cyanobacteria bacterium TGS_CYA1]